MKLFRKSPNVRVERYRGADGQHRFRTRHINGRIATMSSEAYHNFTDMNQAIADAHPGLPVIDVLA